MSAAACLDIPELFFSDLGGGDAAERAALDICRGCPVIDRCEEGAAEWATMLGPIRVVRAGRVYEGMKRRGWYRVACTWCGYPFDQGDQTTGPAPEYCSKHCRQSQSANGKDRKAHGVAAPPPHLTRPVAAGSGAAAGRVRIRAVSRGSVLAAEVGWHPGFVHGGRRRD